jgi:hypothetical protein
VLRKGIAMLVEPECHRRGCLNFLGTNGEDDEEKQKLVCRAFPDGIPPEISYGSESHLEPFPGDNGIQFERENPR